VTDPAGDLPGAESRCPWCSTVLPANPATCPSCGAVLREPPSHESAIPGVTSIDPVVAARKPLPQPNRIVRWLAGDIDPLPPQAPQPLPADVASPGLPAFEGASEASYAPPSDAVRREMALLELEAIKAELEAKAPQATVNDILPGRAEDDAPA
jgi:hypothetical protein